MNQSTLTTHRIAINRQAFASAVFDVQAESPEQAESIASQMLKDREFLDEIQWDEADAQIGIDAVYPIADGGDR